MCVPIAALGWTAATTASVGIGAATAGLSIHGQRQAAKTQAKVQRNATIAEQQRHLQEVSAMRLRQRQEQVAAAQQIQQSATKAREARATARVSAGEAGVAGLSVDALINDMTRKEAEHRFSITQQQQFNDVNRDLGLQDAAMRSRMNLLSINKPIEQPNYAGAILGGISTGLSSYSALSDAGFGASSAASSKPYVHNPSDFDTGIRY